MAGASVKQVQAIVAAPSLSPHRQARTVVGQGDAAVGAHLAATFISSSLLLRITHPASLTSVSEPSASSLCV